MGERALKKRNLDRRKILHREWSAICIGMAVASSRRKAPLTRRLAGRTTLALQVLKSESGMDDTHIPLLAKLAESASYKPGGYSKMSQRVKDLTPFLVLFHCVSLSWAQAVVVVLLLVLSRERSSHGSLLPPPKTRHAQHRDLSPGEKTRTGRARLISGH